MERTVVQMLKGTLLHDGVSEESGVELTLELPCYPSGASQESAIMMSITVDENHEVFELMIRAGRVQVCWMTTG